MMASPFSMRGERGAKRGVLMPTNDLGEVCLRWKHGACVKKTAVRQVAGKQAAHFLAKMATDVDGSPRAYHPLDEQDPDNDGCAFDWLTSVKPSDLLGIQ